MRFAVCLAAVLMTCSAMTPPALAQTSAISTAAKRYSAQEFFETRSVGLADPTGLGFSADGRFLLLASDAAGTINSYALPIDGEDPIALTQSSGDPIRPLSYFPNDDRALVTTDRGGDERLHILVREADGTLRDLTPGETVRAGLLGWSADRTEFRILSNARDESAFDLYAVDAETYDTRMLLQSDGREIIDVSPDGRWAVMTERTGTADSNIYMADLRTGQTRLATPHEGKVLHEVLGFAPDSSALFYSTDAHGEFAEAYRLDLRTDVASPYLKGDWDISWLRFSPSGRYRVSAFNVDGRTELTLFDLTTGRPIDVGGLPSGDIGQVRFSPDERRIAFTVSSDTAPVDIFVADIRDGQARRLTRSLNPAIAEWDLVEAEMIRFTAAGGVEIPSLLYRPRGASTERPVPAIVWVHGGPDQSRHGYSPTIQHLVNQGYAVIAPNFRGSLGYGKTFFHLDDRAHGEADLDDVIAAGDWMRQQDWIIDDQVAVMGRSYGGFLTVAALAFRPEAFAAGIDIFGVTNWERTLKSIPPWWEALRVALYEEMGDPATDGERHRQISPLFHADRIVRPLLVVQGANDPRVLKAESDELVEAVRANGTPVEYLLFPDEGHGFQKRENLIRAQQVYLAFLETNLRR